ncbi:MAG: hypothetical protein DWQ10_04585 [Calditrichaeota bacterium]|nr:MAG: hypothetical protein DWQ10_04585 [Calditrichota bacterium]
MDRKISVLLIVLLSVALIASFSCSSSQQMAQTTKAPPAPKAPAKHTDVDFTQSCLDCHKSETPDVVAEWESGMHGEVNIGCYICHGDGQEEYYPEPNAETCVSCHSGYVPVYPGTGVKDCFGCHDYHTLRFHPEDTGGFGDAGPQWMKSTKFASNFQHEKQEEINHASIP